MYFEFDVYLNNQLNNVKCDVYSNIHLSVFICIYICIYIFNENRNKYVKYNFFSKRKFFEQFAVLWFLTFLTSCFKVEVLWKSVYERYYFYILY